MRFTATCVLLAAALTGGSASAGIVAQNLPVIPTFDPVTGWNLQDGTFSDALQSNGSYYYSQALAQSFSVAAGQTASLTGIRFWGSSEYLASSTPWLQTSLSSNIVAIQVSILRADAGTPVFPVVQTWTMQIGLFTQKATGNYVPTIYSPVFQLSAALAGNVTLGSGQYVLSIGGVLNNPNGDSFAWTDGQADGSIPSTQAYATVGDTPSEWGTWIAVTDGTSGAFELQGDFVPAPGALALFGLLGASRRRRRG